MKSILGNISNLTKLEFGGKHSKRIFGGKELFLSTIFEKNGISGKHLRRKDTEPYERGLQALAYKSCLFGPHL